MTPRPDELPERRRSVDEGRDAIVRAAAKVLQHDPGAFALEAVAREAGVTRMTVYNQFGSKAGLLDEVFDQLVTRGAFAEMQSVFTEPDVAKAFDALAGVFGRFYTDNRPALLRMRAASGLDPDLDAAIRKRNE